MVFGLRLGLPKKASAAEPPSCESAPSKPAKPTSKSGGGAKNALTVNEFVARTKRIREKGLEPTKPELIAYARYLGIDPVIDGDLMWIADEALNAPLPSEWTEHHDSSDRVFYYNVQTHASSWTHPLEQLHRETYKTIIAFRNGERSQKENEIELDKLRQRSEVCEHEAHAELQSWTEHCDEQGQKFFYNKEMQRSVWTDPRPARCHSLYLQMKVLRELSKHCGQSSPVASKGHLGGGDAGHAHKDDWSAGERGAPLGGGGDPMGSTKTRISAGLSLGGGGSSHRAPREENSSFGGQGMSASNDDMMEGGHKKAKHKKKHRAESEDHPSARGAGIGSASQPDLSRMAPLSQQLQSQDHSLDSGSFKKQLPWDMKKPSSNSVEEVRAALGVSPGMPGRDRLLGGEGRLSSPLLGALGGDVLSNAGRQKVRAGIRLEPLA